MEEPEKLVFTDAEVEPQIRSIVQNSKRYVTFVTPYLDLWGHLQTEIQKAVKRGVTVQIVVRAGEDKRKRTEDLEWLIQNKAEVYELDKLHAKIYMNEKSLLVSSMNLTDASTTNSHEFAVIVTDLNSSETLRKYAFGLLGSGRRFDSHGNQKPAYVRRHGNQLGKCIRCSKTIGFDTKRPLCEDCYEEWNRYGNEEYAERFCHSCGKRADLTKAKPLCSDCYVKSQNR